MLASDVARAMGKPLRTLLTLYPSMYHRKVAPRRAAQCGARPTPPQATSKERGMLQENGITVAPVVTVVRSAEVDALLERRTAANNAFALQPMSTKVRACRGEGAGGCANCPRRGTD